MFKRSALFAALALSTFAQDDADIPAKFRTRISPETYHQLRNEHLNTLRGLPADPALREAAINMRNLQLRNLAISGPNTNVPGPVAPSWTALGPSPIPNGQVIGSLAVSGRATAFVIDPTNANKLYLGTAQGGIYRSLDGGTNWTQIFDGASTSAIGALALAPSNSSILYVGTGEANGSADSYAGVGMYRIDNCDTTATLVGPINPVRNYQDGSNNPASAQVFYGRSISSILVHPTDPSIVFVGVAGGVIGIGGDAPGGGTIPPLGMRGLYRLTNATSTPNAVVAQKLTVTLAASGFDTPNTGNRNVNSMAFDPTDPNTLVVWINGATTAGDGGIYRSTNAQSANPTFTQVLATTLSSARGEFAVYQEGANPAVFYVASGEGSSSAGGRLRRSTDAGATWSAVITAANGFCGGQCFYNIGLDVLPGATTATSDDIVVLGGNVAGASTRLFAKSTNGGTSFTETSDGLHADTHFIKISRANNAIIYHGNDGGIFKSTNTGATWATLNNGQINTVQFSGLAVHPTDPKWSIGGTQDNGTNMRKADGTWNRVDFGDGGYALIDRNATDTTNITLYHTYFNQTNNLIGFGRILSSACASDGLWAFKGIYGGSVDPTPNCDGSDTFNGIPITDAVLFYAPMELGPGNPSQVYFGAGALYRSTNKGDTMAAVSQSTSAPVSTIAVSPQDDNYRMFGRSNGTVFYTTTGANPMTALAGIPARYIGRVKFDPSNKNTAYVTLGGYFGNTLTASSHVWKVTNLGTSPVVTGINNGLPDVPVNAFAVDPANGNNLFAGTDIGVYGSTDGGASWTPYGTNLPVVAVFGMEVQPTSRVLRIATHGRGMYEAPLPTLPATVTNVTSSTANGTYGASANISIQVTFSAAVNVTGTPSLALNSGGTASYTSGAGSSTLTFTYTVAPGHASADLDYTSTSALTGTIDTASATLPVPAAVLTLPSPGSAGSLGANKNIVISTTAPSVTSFRVKFGSQTFQVNGSGRTRLPWQPNGIQVLFSEAVNAPQSALTGVTPTGVSGSGTSTVNWPINTLVNGNYTASLSAAITNLSSTPIAPYNQPIRILYGDINDDGVVNSSDVVLVNNARSQAYNILADVNGDGVVDINDVNIVRAQVGKTNP